MLSVNIQTSNPNIIDAIKAIIKFDPEATVTYDEICISDADQARLEELVAMDERGELKYHSRDEVVARTNELLRKLGASV